MQPLQQDLAICTSERVNSVQYLCDSPALIQMSNFHYLNARQPPIFGLGKPHSCSNEHLNKEACATSLHGMESNSSARLTDKNTQHAKVRISHVLVSKLLVIFCKTRTGLNLCNKQFNCTSKFPSDLYLLGLDHTFTLLHSAGSAARQDKFRMI